MEILLKFYYFVGEKTSGELALCNHFVVRTLVLYERLSAHKEPSKVDVTEY